MPAQQFPRKAADNRIFTLDARGLLEFGETLSAITSVVPTDPSVTISGQTINAADLPVRDPNSGIQTDIIPAGKAVQFRMSGGAAGLRYTVALVLATSNGNTVEEDARFAIY